MAAVRKFLDQLPEFLHVLPEKEKPLIWLPKERALQFERFKIYQNDRRYLMLDYDDHGTGARTHKDYDLEPNIIIYNPYNNNHQALWELTRPVYSQAIARMNSPYQYLKAIERAYDEKYQGDKHFARYISRNPAYVFCDTDWVHSKTHSLNELAEVVNLDAKRIKAGDRVVKGGGRNATVFDDLRFWAYKQDTSNIKFDEWVQRCKVQAIEYNAFKEKAPLSLSEVTSIAKSVAQYTYNKSYAESKAEYIARTHTSEIQSARGKRSAEKRWANHVKQEPWLELGISKATYYRRKNK